MILNSVKNQTGGLETVDFTISIGVSWNFVDIYYTLYDGGELSVYSPPQRGVYEMLLPKGSIIVLISATGEAFSMSWNNCDLINTVETGADAYTFAVFRVTETGGDIDV